MSFKNTDAVDIETKVTCHWCIRYCEIVAKFLSRGMPLVEF